MAFAAKTGVFTSKATTGAQAIPHGLPEAPSLVIMWSSAKSDAATAGNFYRMQIGAASSATKRGYVGVIESENTSPVANQHILKTDKLFGTINNNSTILNECDLVSFDATNINITWSTALAVTIDWIAFSGCTANVFNFDLSASAGAQNVPHGLGAVPKVAMLLGAIANTTPGFADGVRMTYGAGTAAGQWAGSLSSQNGVNPVNAGCSLVTDAIHHQVDYGGSAAVSEASLTSMDATNLVLDVVTAEGAAAKTLLGVVIGGDVDAVVGTDTQKTSTGTQAKTGLGIAPEFAMFAGPGRSALGEGSNGAFMMGAASSISNRVVQAINTLDGATAGSLREGRLHTSAQCYAHLDPASSAGGAGIIRATADLSSFDADGYTLDYNVADATARIFGFLALAAAAGGGGGSFQPAWARGSNVILQPGRPG